MTAARTLPNRLALLLDVVGLDQAPLAGTDSCSFVIRLTAERAATLKGNLLRP